MNDTPLSLPELLGRTPARVLAGRCGPGYRTATALKLREDHAAARDAVHAEIELLRDFGSLVEKHGLFEVRSRATTKAEYLRRPDLGRRLSAESAARICENCATGVDLQIVIGDGLSATAAAVQAPEMVERLMASGLRAGRPFLVHHCRVGVMNEIGDLISPEVLVLLIGERPGLATAESLSAYMAYRPRTGHTDADRNLVSNIHARGVGLSDATERILKLAEFMRVIGRSGTGVTESQYTPPSSTLAAAPAVPPP